MINRRILISTAAVCALSASVAGGAAAMPIDDSVSEMGLFPQRATSPMPAADTADGTSSSAAAADELSLFHRRAHRFCVERACDAPDAGEKALDREYELAGYVRVSAGTTAPVWFDALLARSDALNRMHGLGAYASLAH